MKKLLLILLSALPLLASCEELMQTFTKQGILQIRFAQGTVPSTRAAFPDTNDFIITITDGKGNAVYDGTYGALEENLQLDEGSYTVAARSCEFSAPMFDTPQYGDTQVAAVKAGKTTLVTLACVQLNAGIRLNIDQAFLTAYPNAVLYLKATSGKLMYSYTERRIAYFQPGTVNLEMSDGGKESTLFSRRLEQQQILTLGVGVGAESQRSGVSVTVDTSRIWTSDYFIIGDSGKTGGDTSKAYSVPEAKKHTGEEDVWVYGYIVGGDLSSSKCSFSAPFSSRTNIVLADKSSTRDKSKCLSVQLAKGDLRDALNLVDHPENLGRQIYLKGDIVEAYYGIPGLQNLSEYQYK
ncbi:MAG: DUF4493 domain-containing protein [Bacteroidales bacterium]|nr:DUF4493 domain-containing protein [Bacteroidales bacterium]